MLSLASRRDLVRVGLEPMPNTWQINLPRIIESPLDSETVKFSIPRQYTRRLEFQTFIYIKMEGYATLFLKIID